MKALIPLLLLSACALFAEEKSQVYYPAEAPAPVVAPAAHAPIATSVLYIAFLGALGYAVYLFWRRKVVPQRTTSQELASIDITTTRPLGNRQFLVVVKYHDRELLLGVGQGFITRLDENKEASSCGK